ncbi:hypothetical protein J3P71_03970 [Rhizobium leguminosarum]|uniref:hypothetical protein n=1 Tax=Rhizobium leguminosarum TaxID=384 RepID=UPI0014422E77|nr:hypothetical protein [Rhizobium leguminosarum]MBY5841421.1 hypothetical protein [Rhizobium leguminosarum]NKM81416.1 hypothetical protein [Rhizobium leguminosarum bv. viciae]QSZ08944.1 hypothetical protein J3P71_03970 [Rhizobium leguminosarum]
MADIGGLGSFGAGFAQSFANSRERRASREQLQQQRAREEERDRRQQEQFDEGMAFKKQQADALENYRAKQFEIQQDTQQKLAINQQKQMDINITSKLVDIANPTIPKGVRLLSGKKLLTDMGIDPKSQEAKDALDALVNLDSEALAGVRAGLAMALPTAAPGEIANMAQGVFSGKVDMMNLVKMGQDAKQQQMRQEAFGGSQVGQAPAPSSRIMSGTPMAQQAGGNMPIPGMQQPGGDQSPADLRRKAAGLFQSGDLEGGKAALQLARDLEGAGTQGTMGAIPSGYEAYVGQDGRRAIRPMRGSPAETEQTLAAQKEAGREKDVRTSGNLIIQDLGRALSKMDTLQEWPVGPEVAIRRHWPGDDFYDLDQTIATVKANTSFAKLQEMRQNSPTGGALGNVSDKEGERLERTMGNLDIAQSREVVADNLRRLSNITMDIVYGTPEQIDGLVKAQKITPAQAAPLIRRYPLSFDEFGKPVGKAITKDEYDRLPSGSLYIAPDGNQRRKP